MFELSGKEFENLRCQFGTSNWDSVRYAPLSFTEQGVAMLSSVLNSEHAIRVNIQIMRIFTKMRALLSSHKEILQKLEQAKQDETEFKSRKRIGFEQTKLSNN
jgi:hypothetical protein